MTCQRCTELQTELTNTRKVALTLWEELRMRYHLQSGRFDLEPVPPLGMLTDVVPTLEKEAA